MSVADTTQGRGNGGSRNGTWADLRLYQLYQHEEASMQRTTRRRVMVVSNPDPTDESDGEVEIKTVGC